MYTLYLRNTVWFEAYFQVCMIASTKVSLHQATFEPALLIQGSSQDKMNA